MTAKSELIAHLKTGATTTCRAWAVTRRDGLVYGFTDHDRDLSFDGISFKANSGLTAGALQQTTGLAVDNTEVIGSLRDDAISETDLLSGRFDGADVVTWLVNWRNTDQRSIRFRGRFGEIRLSGGSFRVELRGLTDQLNQARGRVYQAACPAVLGDQECQVDLSLPSLSVETVIKRIGRSGEYFLPSQPGFDDRWFDFGRVRIQTGAAEGMIAVVRRDAEKDGFRRIELMADFDLLPEVGDAILLYAGCDKQANTCRVKFNNFMNFRGFPHVPSSDWMASYPVSTQVNDGSSRLK
jgi:uncharacterized phage protein (TIGR02218 family)